MVRLNVRCCCQPTKIFGTLEVEDFCRERILLQMKPVVTEAAEEVPARDPLPVAEIKKIFLKADTDFMLEEYAVYSDDRPLEFWRSVEGFIEGDVSTEALIYQSRAKRHYSAVGAWNRVMLFKGSVLQPWALDLSYMQQSVLISAVRAPDGMRKDHPVKVIMRWYRRCLLLSAFDGRAILNPFKSGGGSFTGPFTENHARSMGLVSTEMENAILYGADINWWPIFNQVRDVYLRHVDEMPHHFQLHMMHAAQIMGYKHDDPDIRIWWQEFYGMIVDDAHLYPEPEPAMDLRLSDDERAWRAREVATAR